MNAEKIEVGDVWKNKYDGSLCHIISVKKDEVTYFCKKDRLNYDQCMIIK